MASEDGARMRVKICGITSVEDAQMVVEAGADMLGLNFVPSSRRYLDVDVAAAIVRSVSRRVEVIGVVADLELPALEDLRRRSGVDAFQLHGSEPPELLGQLPSSDFKAVRIATASDVEWARAFPGTRLLVDAKVAGALGGTGHAFDWSLIGELVNERQLLLAGGLHAGNVGAAVAVVRPWAVDVASGVERRVTGEGAAGEGVAAESSPRKDPSLVAQFVSAARA